jgi:hypothetical protein
MSDTQPTKIKKKSPLAFWISLIILVASLALGGLSGYGSGIGIRISAEKTQVAGTLGEQFTLAQEDFAARRFQLAEQRLEYILKKQSNYPGASDLLARVLVEMAITPSPTVTPSPTITPTPDLREQEAIFNQIQQQIIGSDWDNALAALDALRKRDVNYKTAQVDGMYYIVLRNRGVAKILGQGVYGNSPNLEGGIYDLTLAERFGPLDGQAAGLRNFARLYIQGASYWEVDWPQAVQYFGQLHQSGINLRDGSLVPASERYRIALLKYGDILASAGKLKDRCEALGPWGTSASIGGLDAEYSRKYNDLNLECNPPTATPTATSEVVPTPEISPTP